MAKAQKAYTCAATVVATTPKWQGQCPACGCLEFAGAGHGQPVKRSPGDWQCAGAPYSGWRRWVRRSVDRISTGLTELDRTLGGGLVPGSVVLLGGDPGIGKSTLLLQAATRLKTPGGTLYASGEESLQQISLRGQRLGCRSRHGGGDCHDARRRCAGGG